MTLAQVDEWNGATRVRFDDAGRRNSLALDTVEQLRDVLARDSDRVIVLGSTTKIVFSAGADITVDDATRAKISDLLYECYELMVTRPGLVVAVVEGSAVGGGSQLASAADVRVLGTRARFKWVGAGHGLVVGAWILPSLLGRSTALDLAMCSDWVEADDAVRIGLASAVQRDPWAHTESLLKRFSALDPNAVAGFKQLANSPDLLQRLAAERRTNATWDGQAPAKV